MSEHNKIDEIKAVLAAATPGPWEWREGDASNYEKGWFFGSNGIEVCWFGDATMFYPVSGDEPDEKDINLIAKAPEYITYLLAEIERKDAEIERKDEALEFYAEEGNYLEHIIGWGPTIPAVQDGGKRARAAL